MNDHFRPVGNPAPPRPRSPDSFTMFTMSPGAMPSAFSSALYPPRFFQPSRVRASASPKYCDNTVVSRGCGWCGKPMCSGQSCKKFGDFIGRHRFDELLIHHHGRREATSAQTLDLDDRELAVGRCNPELASSRMPQKGLHYILSAADSARRRRADLDEVFADGVLVIHGVEGHHAFDICGSELEQLGDFNHSFFRYPAALALNDPERRKERGHFVRIAREQLVELFAHITGEDRL